MCVVLCVYVCLCVVLCVCVCVCVVLGRMCVVLQVVLGRMCVVLQVLRQVLGLGLGLGWGRGLLRSSLFTHPQNLISPVPANPEPHNIYIYILKDTGPTPEGKKCYLPKMVSERYGMYGISLPYILCMGLAYPTYYVWD